MSPRPQPGREFVLTVSCPDRPGLVFAVSSYFVQHRGNILSSQQFDDRSTGEFFMRVVVEIAGGGDLAQMRADFAPVADSFAMTWELVDAATPTRTLLMVSRFGHCLNDLLFRHSSGLLPLDIPAVVSNHLDLEPMAKQYGLPFHHIPISPDTKADAEATLLQMVESHDIELVVLARYMQVLSPELSRRLSGRVINIHHSFLPSFKGAKPYHQAHSRGVKLVGATAHYVTDDLDEGPIIEQDVVRVDHQLAPEELVEAGRDVEAQVLARAVRWHAERRVLLNGHSTVVFR
ncbi:MAG: formyltetrahydrofolate deformylase [Actinomycetales bacterium]